MFPAGRLTITGYWRKCGLMNTCHATAFILEMYAFYASLKYSSPIFTRMQFAGFKLVDFQVNVGYRVLFKLNLENVCFQGYCLPVQSDTSRSPSWKTSNRKCATYFPLRSVNYVISFLKLTVSHRLIEEVVMPPDLKQNRILSNVCKY